MSEQTTNPESADTIVLHMTDGGVEWLQEIRASDVDLWREYWERGSADAAIRFAPVSEIVRLSRFGNRALRSEAQKQKRALLWFYGAACIKSSVSTEPDGDQRGKTPINIKFAAMAAFMQLLLPKIRLLLGQAGLAIERGLSA